MMTRPVGTDTERVGDFRVRLALGEAAKLLYETLTKKRREARRQHLSPL
jgi:hypothetical protein